MDDHYKLRLDKIQFADIFELPPRVTSGSTVEKEQSKMQDMDKTQSKLQY